MSITNTADFLRPEVTDKGVLPHQRHNARWFYELVKTPIELATGEKPELWFPEGCAFPSPEAWAHVYENGDFNPPQPLADVVVGFEMPPSLCRAIEAAGTSWINCCLHPARYMDDLCFGVTASTNIAPLLPEFAIAPETFRIAAGIVRARMSRLPDLKLGDFWLFTCQTPQDASLIHDGRFYSWRDFRDIEDHVPLPHRVIWKPHPHAMKDDFCPSGSVVAAQNVYRLMCQPGCKGVVSLSSSTLWEAQQFGLETIALLPARGLVQTPVASHRFLEPGFWASLLRDSHRIQWRYFNRAPVDSYVPARPNRLRSTIAERWGDDFLYEVNHA